MRVAVKEGVLIVLVLGVRGLVVAGLIGIWGIASLSGSASAISHPASVTTGVVKGSAGPCEATIYPNKESVGVRVSQGQVTVMRFTTRYPHYRFQVRLKVGLYRFSTTVPVHARVAVKTRLVAIVKIWPVCA
jgi:hypothetical protein